MPKPLYEKLEAAEQAIAGLRTELQQAQEERDRWKGRAQGERGLQIQSDRLRSRYKAERDAAIERAEVAEALAHDLRLQAAESIGALRAGRDLISAEMMGTNQHLAGWCEAVDFFVEDGDARLRATPAEAQAQQEEEQQ